MPIFCPICQTRSLKGAVSCDFRMERKGKNNRAIKSGKMNFYLSLWSKGFSIMSSREWTWWKHLHRGGIHKNSAQAICPHHGWANSNSWCMLVCKVPHNKTFIYVWSQRDSSPTKFHWTVPTSKCPILYSCLSKRLQSSHLLGSNHFSRKSSVQVAKVTKTTHFAQFRTLCRKDFATLEELPW